MPGNGCFNAPETQLHILPKRGSVESIDDRVSAGVQQAKEKEAVVDILRHLLDHGWLEPVPQTQEVVWGPADDEGGNNHYGHLEGLHACLGDVVILISYQTYQRKLKRYLEMGEKQKNITTHDCTSAREEQPPHGLVHGPQEAEDSKQEGQEVCVKPFG